MLFGIKIVRVFYPGIRGIKNDKSARRPQSDKKENVDFVVGSRMTLAHMNILHW